MRKRTSGHLAKPDASPDLGPDVRSFPSESLLSRSEVPNTEVSLLLGCPHGTPSPLSQSQVVGRGPGSSRLSVPGGMSLRTWPRRPQPGSAQEQGLRGVLSQQMPAGPGPSPERTRNMATPRAAPDLGTSRQKGWGAEGLAPGGTAEGSPEPPFAPPLPPSAGRPQLHSMCPCRLHVTPPCNFLLQGDSWGAGWVGSAVARRAAADLGII